MKKGLTTKEVEKIAIKNKDDVCQLGVDLASKYSENEDEYDDIWTAAQDMFSNNMMGSKYNLKSVKVRKVYAEKLCKYLRSSKFRGKAVLDK